MAGSKPTRRSRSRSATPPEEQEPAPRRRRRQSTRPKNEPEETTGVHHPRLGDKRIKNWNAPKPPDLARRARAEAPPPDVRTVVLAMSPHAANILRALLGRANHDVPELHAIYNELEDQLAEPSKSSGRKRGAKKRRRDEDLD